MRRLIVLLMLTLQGCRAPQLALCEMPRLIVITTQMQPDGRTASAACGAFWNDWRDPSTGLSRALIRSFDVDAKYHESNPLLAPFYGVRPQQLPAFIARGRVITGYTSPQDLCVRLGLGVVETPAEAKPPAKNAASPPADVPFGAVADPRFDQLVEELKAQQRERDETNRRVAAGETTAAAAASKLDRLQRSIEEIAGRLADQATGRAPAEAKPDPPAAKSSARDWLDLALGAASVAAPYLGIAIPGGGVAALGIWGVRWLLNRRKRSADPIASTPVSPPAVVVETQPPLHTVTTVVDHSHEHAFTWACDQLIRKWPANADVVETLKGLIQQYAKERTRV